MTTMDTGSPRAPAGDISGELEKHRTYLMRVALLQLRDENLAEDVVQETMVSALATKTFSGASTLRTWLTAILKHKIIDAIRRRQKLAEVPESSLRPEGDSDLDDFDSPFDEQGGWLAKPADWGDPEEALNQRQFMDTLDGCMKHLSPKLARVFVMREYMELEVEEISRELDITPANIYVILFRARAGLRQCMENKWLGRQPARRGRGSP